MVGKGTKDAAGTTGALRPMETAVSSARLRFAGRRLRPSRLAVALLLLGLSCGDSGDAGSAEAFVGSYCDLFSPCCAKANLRSDGQQCRAFLGAFASSSQYDQQKGEACLAAMREASGRADFCDTSAGPAPAACDAVFGTSAGTKPPGATCDDDDECAPSAEGDVECVSSFAGGAEVRKCQVHVRGKAGDQPCVGDVDGNSTVYNGLSDLPSKGYLCHAQDGLRCDAMTDTCVAFKAIGEACSSTSSFRRECVVDAYCDGTQRKCAARKAIGSACTDTGFSQTECVAGAYCGQAKTCMAQVSDGGACTTDQQCRSNDCVNGACKAAGSGDLGLTLICGTK
ncbi:MAG TPA: hypothetical protein VGF45_06975 [Polyangia bacterium]